MGLINRRNKMRKKLIVTVIFSLVVLNYTSCSKDSLSEQQQSFTTSLNLRLPIWPAMSAIQFSFDDVIIHLFICSLFTIGNGQGLH